MDLLRKKKLVKTSSNHRLESADLNALEELLFKMLGKGREAKIVMCTLSAKEIGYGKTTLVKA